MALFLEKFKFDLMLLFLLNPNLSRCIHNIAMVLILELRLIGVSGNFTNPRKHKEHTWSKITVRFLGFNNEMTCKRQLYNPASTIHIDNHIVLLIDL